MKTSKEEKIIVCTEFCAKATLLSTFIFILSVYFFLGHSVLYDVKLQNPSFNDVHHLNRVLQKVN